MSTCAICTKQYDKVRSTQKVCSPECAIVYARGKLIGTKKAEQRKRDKAKKESLKTLSDHRKDAQKAFNQYVRVRDENKGCISCNTKTAGQYHAGHYRTRKAAPQLAFNCLNVWKQCAQCNNFESGNIAEYRKNLVLRIGESRVRSLEHDNRPANHSAEYLARVKAIFSRRARHIAKVRERAKARKDREAESNF